MHHRVQTLASPLIVALAFTISSCSSGNDTDDDGTAINLRLAEGADSKTATFDAQDPRTHTQTIEVDVVPAESVITLEFRTAIGSTLSVLPDRDCATESDRQECTVLFPILEAQSGGEWQAIASKPDGPEASVSVSISWDEANP